MTIAPLKYSYRISDLRCGLGSHLELLSVSAHRGVLPRSDITDKAARADDLSAYKVVRTGDVVINRMSAYQGALGFARQDGIVSPEYIVLKPEGIDGRYLTYMMKSSWFVGEMTQRLRGIGSAGGGASVRTPRINPEDLGSIRCDLPTLAEQRVIADYLDAETARIDALIAKKQQLIHLLEERFAAFREKVLWADAVPAPLHRLTDPLRPIVYGIVQAGPEVEDGVPYIKTGDLALLDEPRRLSHTSFEIDEQYRRSRVHPGDIVVAMRASIGEAVLVPPALPAANLTQGTARIAAAQGVDPGWLLHAFRSRSAQEQCDLRAVGSTFRTLNIWDLRRIEVPAPRNRDFVEVRRRLNQAETVNKEAVECLTRQIALLAEHRQALITAAVAGELSVPGAA